MYQVNSYSLDITGLKISYTKDTKTFNLDYAPAPACELLKELRAISDHAPDKNSEPVVKLQDGERQAWHQFVKLFSIDTHLPLAIAEHHNRQRRELHLHYLGTV